MDEYQLRDDLELGGMEDEVKCAVEGMHRMGHAGYNSKGDLWDVCVPVYPFRLFDGSNGNVLTGNEREFQQADRAYMKPVHTDGEYFFKSLHPRDVITAVREGRAVVGIVGFDLILDAASDEILHDALDDNALRTHYDEKNRDGIRERMTEYIERSGFRVLGYIGKPVQLRHMIAKDAAQFLKDPLEWKFSRKVVPAVEEKFLRIYSAEMDRLELSKDGMKVLKRNVEVTLFGNSYQRDADIAAALLQSGETALVGAQEPHGLWIGPKIINSETVIIACDGLEDTGLTSLAHLMNNVTIPDMHKKRPELLVDDVAMQNIRELEAMSKNALFN